MVLISTVVATVAGMAVTLVTDKAPKFVSVDPYSIWIDRELKDNTISADAPAS